MKEIPRNYNKRFREGLKRNLPSDAKKTLSEFCERPLEVGANNS